MTKNEECKHNSAKAGNIQTQQTLEAYHELAHRALYTKKGKTPEKAKMPEDRAHQHRVSVNLILNRALTKTSLASKANTPAEIKALEEAISEGLKVGWDMKTRQPRQPPSQQPQNKANPDKQV